MQGGWLYNVKDWIDSKWMAKYGADLPEMGGMPMPAASSKQEPAGSEVAASAGPEAVSLLANAHMRCGGCGSKARTHHLLVHVQMFQLGSEATHPSWSCFGTSHHCLDDSLAAAAAGPDAMSLLANAVTRCDSCG